MKKTIFALLPAAVLAVAPSCTKTEAAPSAQVFWEVENLPVDSTGTQEYRQVYTLTGDLRGVQRFCFNQFSRKMNLLEETDTLIELLPGYYAIGSPRFADATGTDTLRFEIVTKGLLSSVCYGPDGTHLVYADGHTAPVELTIADITANKSGYSNSVTDRMPYGDEVFAINESITPEAAAGVYDVIPAFKEVSLTGGESTVNPADAEFKPFEGEGFADEYRITVANGKMTVEAPEKLWKQLKHRLTHYFGDKPVTLPDAVITDWPSYPYRGLMIDIARNFQTPEEMNRVLDIMALYGLNTLHFHPIDDEAWRVEIAALPELTEIGSKRGYLPEGETGYLPQMYTGDGNPESTTTSANGYFTREDYVNMLRHANELGITVIPEIEAPGHARAAIKAMEVRAARTGDNSLLLRELDDTSEFTSAQAFHDNVMSPALEGPYKLFDVVVDEFVDMHKEAGAPLVAIHIGGDEVAHGAWSGSPKVQELMKEQGLESEKEVHAYFVNKLREMFDAKGIKMSGWQEVALRHSDEYNKAVAPSMYSINCWSTLGRNKTVPDELAKAGYPIVLSNVERFYLDMIYNWHPEERGLSWGGTVDEFTALEGYPSTLCTVKDANVIGLQGQVWSETNRNPQTLETMLLPKLLGLAERAWNPEPTYTVPAFQGVIINEIPKWEAAGYAYHVRQPGIRLNENGTFTANTPYPGAVLRYTLDGKTPTTDSPVVEAGAEVPVGDASQIRVKLWLNGHASPVSILYVK